MRILRSVEEMRVACRKARSGDARLGFVPTMGALHEGHLSLVRSSRVQCAVTAVSIFVNPKQFGPNEDFSCYPRDFERDRKMLEAEGVELLFSPSVEEMYRPNEFSYVEVAGMSERLCGRSRPGHFRGVTTVVAKLFNIVQPDRAYFGQKDAAQVAIIQKMVRDLNFDVEIMVCPIIREKDGLAMSSRNAYLGAAERKQALALYRALCRVQREADMGERSAEKLVSLGKLVIAEEAGVKLDYLEIVNPESLEAVPNISRGALVAIAGFVGRTRLIDNILL
jgi:pantoate--beta-alanine ligase